VIDATISFSVHGSVTKASQLIKQFFKRQREAAEAKPFTNKKAIVHSIAFLLVSVKNYFKDLPHIAGMECVSSLYPL